MRPLAALPAGARSHFAWARPYPCRGCLTKPPGWSRWDRSRAGAEHSRRQCGPDAANRWPEATHRRTGRIFWRYGRPCRRSGPCNAGCLPVRCRAWPPATQKGRWQRARQGRSLAQGRKTSGESACPDVPMRFGVGRGDRRWKHAVLLIRKSLFPDNVKKTSFPCKKEARPPQAGIVSLRQAERTGVDLRGLAISPVYPYLMTWLGCREQMVTPVVR